MLSIVSRLLAIIRVRSHDLSFGAAFRFASSSLFSFSALDSFTQCGFNNDSN